MKFNKGDHVKFLDEVGEGLVIAIKGDQIIVRDEHGFEVRMTENQLVLSRPDIEGLHFESGPGSAYQSVVDAKRDHKTGKSELKKHRKKKSTRNEYLEVDLHIHELVEDNAHLSNHEIVTIQLDTFKKMLELARENHYQKVVFIHGVGEGILRYEIRKILHGMSNCEFGDADYGRYGQGATAVDLWYN